MAPEHSYMHDLAEVPDRIKHSNSFALQQGLSFASTATFCVVPGRLRWGSSACGRALINLAKLRIVRE